jgi:thiamine pyrophosphokinase
VRAVIFANGSFNKPATISLEFDADDLVIAADGGANLCSELGIIPDILIGDMDSVQPELINELRSKETQLIVFPRDKDQIDLELALSYALEQKAQDVILFGLLGGRLDLSMANLMLLVKDDWDSMSLAISDGPDTAYVMHGNENIVLQGNPGDIVSLLPLTNKVTDVSSQGLRWPLRNIELKLGSTLSISNEMLEHSAAIRIGEGKLLLVHRVSQELDRKD